MSLFRPKKKKMGSANRVIKQYSDEDEDVNESEANKTAATLRRQQKAHHRRSTGMLRLSETDKDNDTTSEARKKFKSKKSKEKKRRGIGFGGGGIEVNDEPEIGAPHLSSYSSEMLQKLQSEQSYNTKTTDTEKFSPENEDDSLNTKEAVSIGDREVIDKVDFIPLGQSQNEAFVLSGEQAFALQDDVDKQEDGISSHFNKTVASVTADPTGDDKDGADWESRVAQRAGIVVPAAISENQSGPLSSEEKHHPSVSLYSIQQQIKSTVRDLRERTDSLTQKRRHRLVDLELAQTELEDRHRSDLKEAGEAVEFYQVLQVQLADWVGAMRNLHDKLLPLCATLYDLESEWVAQAQWREYEDNVVQVLSRYQLLQQVEGRQPAFAANDSLVELPTIDEFGRDVKSQATREREKIFRQYQTNVVQQGEMFDPALPISMHTEDKQRSFHQRRQALRQALGVARDELDLLYRDVSMLFEAFQKWHAAQERDYRQAYASLSLGDLASVLVLQDLVQASVRDDMEDGLEANFLVWKDTIQEASQSGVLCHAGVERLLRHSVVAFMLGLLSQGGYCLGDTSPKSRGAILPLYKQVVSLLTISSTARRQSPEAVTPTQSKVLVTLRERIRDIFVRALTDLAIPILNSVAPTNPDDGSPLELRLSLQYARETCLERILRMLDDLLTNWGPLFQDDSLLVTSVLTFCSGPFLTLVLSLAEPSRQAPIVRVYNQLEKLGWVSSTYMVEAMPLRAARAAYESST